MINIIIGVLIGVAVGGVVALLTIGMLTHSYIDDLEDRLARAEHGKKLDDVQGYVDSISE